MNKMKKQSGYVLATITIIIAILFLMVFYFLSFIVTDSKLAHSQNLATETYYLAEAGINEALWKIKNDPTWQTSFKTNPTWSESLLRNNPFIPNSYYLVSIDNTGLAEAEISSVAVITTDRASTQRIVKTKVFQATSESAIDDVVMYTDDSMTYFGANLEVQTGSIFTNNDIEANFYSILDIAGDASAVDQINVSWTSSLEAATLNADNYPPAPETIAMPGIDFDSADPNSYKNLADNIYTSSEFDDLLDGTSNLIIDGITYVTGNIDIKKGHNLTVNGMLVADGNINLGTSFWPFWVSNPDLFVNSNGSDPSGIITKRKIVFGFFSDDIQIDGLVYAADEIIISSIFTGYGLNGGLYTRNLSVYDFWAPLNINYDQAIISRGLGPPETSPIINIEHWEEEY